MSFDCVLSNAKLSVLVVGNEKWKTLVSAQKSLGRALIKTLDIYISLCFNLSNFSTSGRDCTRHLADTKRKQTSESHVISKHLLPGKSIKSHISCKGKVQRLVIGYKHHVLSRYLLELPPYHPKLYKTSRELHAGLCPVSSDSYPITRGPTTQHA